MPLYDFRCDCGAEKVDVLQKMKDVNPTCDCGKVMEKLFRPAPLHIFDNEQVFEHVSEQPMRFRSKGELRAHCRRNNLGMDYVE